MENFGQGMPVLPICFGWPCFNTNKYICVSLTFKRHMTPDGTMVYFSVLKSMALSYTPDSENISEIFMSSRNKQSLYKVFHLHKKNYIRDAHATLPLPI